jgi:hypothetical protein
MLSGRYEVRCDAVQVFENSIPGFPIMAYLNFSAQSYFGGM